MNDLTHHENAMIMHQPWTKAEPGSFWHVNAKAPGKSGATWTDCLTVVLPHYATEGHTLFKLVGALDDLISPSWITAARPLMLVERDDPETAYYLDDQEYLRGQGNE